jgi:hypothetical protein
MYDLFIAFIGLYKYKDIKSYFKLEYMTSRKYFHLLGFFFFAPGFIYEVVFGVRVAIAYVVVNKCIIGDCVVY